MKRIAALIACFLLIFSSLVFKAGSAKAFDPSIIIDDATFNNYTSMNANQIDNFLNSFPNSCISSSSGFSTFDPLGWSTFTHKYEYGTTPVSAGKAIADVAQLYHINPQVVLTTLQKEQTLVTGAAGCHPNSPDPNAPFSNTPAPNTTFTCTIGGKSVTCTYACTYSGGCVNIAVGYDCPGYCRASNEGFKEQITLGTWLLRFAQERSEGITTGYVGFEEGDDTLSYSGPMTAHGNFDGNYTTQDGYHLTITEGATASLYNFTPYESGNASFYNIFTGWFGGSYAPDLYTDTDNDGTVDRYDQCYLNAGSPVNFGCPDNTTLESSGYSGDFNGDGYKDVLTLSAFPDGRTFNLWLYKGTSSGLSTSDPTFLMTLGPNNLGFDLTKSKAIAADVNGDGKTDLVIFHKGPHNEVDVNTLIGTGPTPGLQQMTAWTFEQTPANGWQWSNLRIAAAGDFNGDGYDDVAAFSVNPDGHGFNVWLYPGSANGLQAPTQQLSLLPGNGWDFVKSKPAASNVNGDNNLGHPLNDLVIFHRGPNNEIWEHVFKGSTSGLQADSVYGVLSPSQGWLWPNIKVAGVGDFNADGYGDVAVLSQFPNGQTYNILTLNGGASNSLTPQFHQTLGSWNGGWNFWKTKVVTTNIGGYDGVVIFHQGPHDENVRHVFKVTGPGQTLSLDSSMDAWQFPSQGWHWSNVRIIRTGN